MRMSALALALVPAALVAGELAPSTARADPFVELAGGLVAPMADDDWTSVADPGLELAARVGGGGPELGGLASIAWAPIGSSSNLVSLNRLRVLGHVEVRHAVTPKVSLSARLGAGIDYLHVRTEVTLIGVTASGSDSDVGLALELGGGAWFAVGHGSTEIGVELGLPISYHSSDGNRSNPLDPNNRKFDFSTVDLDVLGGVRLRL